MKIVCIDNIKRKIIRDGVIPLTIGKIYETDGGPPSQYRIRCDDGGIGDFGTWRFITIEEFREKRLSELGI
jgi:hypothetical protein